MSLDWMRYREGIGTLAAPHKCQTGRVQSHGLVTTSPWYRKPCPNPPMPGQSLCAQCRAAGLARVLGGC